jgi:transposase-like protein
MNTCICGKPSKHAGRCRALPNPDHPLCPKCSGPTIKSGRRSLADGFRQQEFRCKPCLYDFVREPLKRIHRLADYETRMYRLIEVQRVGHKQARWELGLSHTTFYRLLREMRAEVRKAA